MTIWVLSYAPSSLTGKLYFEFPIILFADNGNKSHVSLSKSPMRNSYAFVPLRISRFDIGGLESIKNFFPFILDLNNF